MTVSEEEINELLAADPEELTALLGASALAVNGNASSLLFDARNGLLYAEAPAVLGLPGAAPFQHLGLQGVANRFFVEWGKQIKQAVCGRDQQFEAARKNGTTVLVGSIVSAITTHVPELAPYNTLLLVLAAIIIQSGFQAFCTEKA